MRVALRGIGPHRPRILEGARRADPLPEAHEKPSSVALEQIGPQQRAVEDALGPHAGWLSPR